MTDDLLNKVAEAIKHGLLNDGGDAWMDGDNPVNDFVIDGTVNLLSAAQAAIDAMGYQWRPIEEYREGETVLVDTPQLESGCTMAYRQSGAWCSIFDGKPFGRHVTPPKWFTKIPTPPK
ncbi:MAG TPA: hypothetical protein VN039_13680 [Nitrospira sp.]|nr:hypothetical protein [Nitrospira sp.]